MMYLGGVWFPTYFAQGKRGVIYRGTYKKKEVAIKVKKSSSQAPNTIKKESETLRLVNAKGIGPKYVKSAKKYVMYEFVEGVFFKDWLKTAKTDEKKKAFLDLLKQCYTLDQLGINKEEMLRPSKNVLMTKSGPVLIDFERSHKSEKPKNVTQFLQFLGKVYPQKTEQVRRAAKEYREKGNFEKVYAIIGKF